MASVNKLFKIGLALLMFIYVIYLLLENFRKLTLYEINSMNKISRNILAKPDIDGVILGGSNSLFTLSAEKISKMRSEKWLNLSIVKEGITDKNYWNFIKDTLTLKQRESIKNIVYSTVSPLREHWAEDRYNTFIIQKKFIWKLPKSIKPSSSILVRWKNFFLKNEKKKYPLPNSFGDFDFTKYDCNLIKKQIQEFKPNENKKKIYKRTSKQLKATIQLFPNSKIYYAIPFQYYKNIEASKRANLLNDILEDVIINFNKKNNTQVYFVPQLQFSNKTLLCDFEHHGNLVGQSWRTDKLLQTMKSLNIKSK